MSRVQAESFHMSSVKQWQNFLCEKHLSFLDLFLVVAHAVVNMTGQTTGHVSA